MLARPFQRAHAETAAGASTLLVAKTLGGDGWGVLAAVLLALGAGHLWLAARPA